METKELRINNLFKTTISRDRGEAKVVYGVKGNNVYVDEKYCYDITHIKPIPITEEWLLKFGFKKNEPEISDGFFNWWNKNKDVSVDVEYVLTDNGVENLFYFVISDGNGFRPYKHIIYVHSLQNLYFALTGKELELCKQN